MTSLPRMGSPGGGVEESKQPPRAAELGTGEPREGSGHHEPCGDQKEGAGEEELDPEVEGQRQVWGCL